MKVLGAIVLLSVLGFSAAYAGCHFPNGCYAQAATADHAK